MKSIVAFAPYFSIFRHDEVGPSPPQAVKRGRQGPPFRTGSGIQSLLFASSPHQLKTLDSGFRRSGGGANAGVTVAHPVMPESRETRSHPVMPESREIRSEATIFLTYPASRADG